MSVRSPGNGVPGPAGATGPAAISLLGLLPLQSAGAGITIQVLVVGN